MFNDHQDIIKIVEEAIYSAYNKGVFCNQISTIDEISDDVAIKVQQRLEYMQSQIDELQLEYCPEEMSKEQLDNWAKNQKPVEEGIIPLRHAFNECYGDLDKTI